MWIYILLGSGLGGLARYLVATGVQRLGGGSLPYGTLVVNVAGSLLIGALLRHALMAPAMSAELRTFLVVGICGGFTTFSAFSAETFELLRTGSWGTAVAYALTSVVLCVAATAAGFALAGSQRLAAP